MTNCSVCFIASKPLLPQTAKVITCSKCSRQAHKYCYNPSASQPFSCDSCLQDFKGSCYICDNPGMLKKIGKHFAHPICLLFNQSVIVNSYLNLTFRQIDNLRTGKKSYCHICKKQSYGLLKCPYKCTKMAHFYCVLRSTIDENINWLSYFQPVNSQTTFPYRENIFLKALRTSNKFLSNRLGLSKQNKNHPSPVYVICSQHSATFVECRCSNTFPERQQWIQCQSCFRWQHLQCTNFKGDVNKGYNCDNCFKWRQTIQKQQYSLEISLLPKLQIYDLIFISVVAKKMNYNMGMNLKQILLSLPIIPSLEEDMLSLRPILLQRLKRKINIDMIKIKIQKCSNDKTKIIQFLSTKKEQIQLVWWINKSQPFSTNQYPILQSAQQDQHIDQNQIKIIMQILDQYSNYCGTKTDIFKNTINLFFKPRQKYNNQNHKDTEINKQKNRKIDKVRPFQQMTQQQVQMKHQNKQQDKNIEQNILQLLNELLRELKNTNIVQNIINIFSKLNKYLNKYQNLHYVDLVKKNQMLSFIKNSHSSVYTFVQMKYSKNLNKIRQEMSHILQRYNLDRDLNYLQQLFKFNNQKNKILSEIKKIDKFEIKYQALKTFYENQYKNCITAPTHLSMIQIQNNQININNIQTVLQIYKHLHKNVSQLQFNLHIVNIIKKSNFTPKSKSQITNIRSALPEKSNINIGKDGIQNYLLLYNILQQYFMNEKTAINEQCLLQKLKKRKIKTHSTCMKILIKYFIKLKNLELNYFQKKVQQILKQKIQWIVQIKQNSQIIFNNDQQMEMLSIWCQKLSIISPKCRNIIDIDRSIQHQLSFIGINFENPKAIMCLQQKLKQYWSQYQKIGLYFRLQKIQLIQSWISIYNELKKQLNQQMSEQQDYKTDYKTDNKQRLDRQYKANNIGDYFLVKTIYQFAIFISFPECNFIKKIQNLIKQSTILYQQIKILLNSCNWRYIYNRDNRDSKNTYPVQKAIHLLNKLKYSKLKFKVQALQIEIIIKDFYQNSKRAQSLLIDLEGKSIESSNRLSTIKEILTQFGKMPFQTQLYDKLQKIVILIQYPDQQRIIKKQIFEDFKKQPFQFSNDIGYELYHYFIINNDKKQAQEIQNIMKQFENISLTQKNIFSKFKQGICFTEQDFNFIQKIIKKYQQKKGPCYIIIQQLKLQFQLFKIVQKWCNRFRQGMLKNHESLKSLSRIINRIHPCFTTSALQSLKQRAIKNIQSQPNVVLKINQ